MFPRFKEIQWNNPGTPYQENPRMSAGKGSRKSLPNGGRMAIWKSRHSNLGLTICVCPEGCTLYETMCYCPSYPVIQCSQVPV